MWVRKTITRWTPACNIVLFWYITGTDFGRKIWPWDRSLFSLNSPTQILEFGGARAKPAFENPGFWVRPGGPRRSPAMDVNHCRSEPGNTRLS